MELRMSDKSETSSNDKLLDLAKQALNEDFGRLHPAWVEQHLHLFTTLRKIFGSDLDKPIILGIIGQVMFKEVNPHQVGYNTALEYDGDGDYPYLTNVESISLSSGIPRETVRRKVHEMLESGWIRKDAKGRVFVTTKATLELDEATQISFSLLADMFVRIARTMDSKGLIRMGYANTTNDS
jgi:hypothetical protein